MKKKMPAWLVATIAALCGTLAFGEDAGAGEITEFSPLNVGEVEQVAGASHSELREVAQASTNYTDSSVSAEKKAREGAGYLTAESDPSTALTNGVAWVRGKKVLSEHQSLADYLKTSSSQIAIGPQAKASGNWYNVAIGYRADATPPSVYNDPFGGRVAIGKQSIAHNCESTAVGTYAHVYSFASLALGRNAGVSADSSFGCAFGNESLVCGDSGFALGNVSYATTNCLGISYSPDNTYFCSSNTTKNAGSTARSLRSYIRYSFQTPATNEITCADGNLYSLTADKNGVLVTLPVATAYVQDFVIRLEPADTKGTSLASIAANPADATVWQYDYPLGTNAVRGVVTEATYFTFTQVTTNRWSVGCYPATKKED